MKYEQDNIQNNINTTLIPFENENYLYLRKANVIIGASYRSTLNEQKVLWACMYKLQKREYTETKDDLVVSMTTGELKELLNTSANSLYNQLDSIAQAMTARTIGITNPDDEMFKYVSLISSTSYGIDEKGNPSPGLFVCKFNNEMKQYLVNLESQYTPISRRIAMSFKSVYSFRLYELIKKNCYYPKSYKGKKSYIFAINMSVSELKLNLGVVNSELDSVRRVLNNSKTPNYDKACEASPEKMYNDWSMFRKRCIDPAVKEINEKADLKVEYTVIKGGQGGKVQAIKFIVKTPEYFELINKMNNNYDEVPMSVKDGVLKPDLSTEEKFAIYLEVLDLFKKYQLTYQQVINMVDDLDFNKDGIIKAYHILEQQKGQIDNVVGWIIAAVKNNYEPNVTKPAENNQKYNRFNDFPQREYDFADIEKQLRLNFEENL